MLPQTPIRDIVDRCLVWESHADSDARRISKPGPDRAFPTYVVSNSERGTDDRRVAAVHARSVGDFASTAACWSSHAGSTPETGAPYCGTVATLVSGEHAVTRLVSGDSGSKACPGRGDWEFRYCDLAAKPAFWESGAGDATSIGSHAT